MAATLNSGFWGSMVALNNVVTNAMSSGSNYGASFEASSNLDIMMKKHRSTFISLLRNPLKSANERATLQRAVQEPVLLPGYTLPMKLPESFITEVFIISDMFDLSEMSAFSLLKSAEEEKTLYPGIPRGLVAVLLYYDSREKLANAFKTLVQARQGLSWSVLPDNEELSCTITQYLDPILNTSMADRIINLIMSMDLSKEIELLQKNRALGNAKHRNMVIEKFKSVKSILAETLFCWAAQTPLKREELKILLNYLSTVKESKTKDGSLDKIDLNILIAVMYSIDLSYLLIVEDITDAVGQFPLTNDSKFLSEIHYTIKDTNWMSMSLLAVIQMCWCVTLSVWRQVSSDTQLLEKETINDEDEIILDSAVKNRPFYFLEKSILLKDNSFLDTFHLQKIHNFLTDFITNLFDKVKLFKSVADENARKIAANVREGLDPPINLEQPYEDLLNCLAALYSDGKCGEAVEEYWYDNLYSSNQFRSQNMKQVALYRFVRLPGDYVPPSLFVPYLKFLAAIATTPKAAQSVYNFLRMNSYPAAQGSNLSWENFLSAFSQYYDSLRMHQPQSMNETVYQSSSRTGMRISPQELQGLITVLHLIHSLALNDESSRIALCNNSSYSAIHIFIGLLTCNIPLNLKAWILKTLAAFSISSNLGGRIWKALESASLVPIYDGTPGYTNRGLRQDIEEVESRYEEFPLSQAFLDLMNALVKTGVPYQVGMTGGGTYDFRPCLELVKNHIFLPHDSRTYKNVSEKWILSRKSLELFWLLLKDFQPESSAGTQNENWKHPSQVLLLELVQDSKLVRQIFSVLHDGVKILEQYSSSSEQVELEKSLLYLLEIILIVYKLQRQVLSKENVGVLLTGIDRLLMSMNSRSGCCDHLVNISLILGHHVSLAEHASLVCKILTLVGSSPSGQSHLVPLLTTPSSRGISFRQNFVQLLDHATLDENHVKAAESALLLLKSCLRLPSNNIAHFLLGFTDGSSLDSLELRSDLLEPGVRGFPRTALHAVLSSLPSLTDSLASSAYHLIYMLTSTPNTSSATLRYLSSHNFVQDVLSSVQTSSNYNDTKLQSVGWILRIVALDLRYHALHNQKSQLRSLIEMLVLPHDRDFLHTQNVAAETSAWGAGISSTEDRSMILSLLEITEFSVEFPSQLHSQFLARFPNILQMCEEKVGNLKLINVQTLHQSLLQLTQVDGGPVSRNDPIATEIEKILDYALSLNLGRKMFAAQRHYIESWRQLVEVVVSVSPGEVTKQSSHQAFIHNITLELTKRLLDESALPELSSLLASTLLLLVTTLRTLHASNTILNKQLQNPLPTSLQLILKGVTDCIIKFRHAYQSIRASLYASFLNYLQIHSDYSKQAFVSIQGAGWSKENIVEQFHRENYETLREDLSRLIDIWSYEASAGHLVCKLLSVGCLDAVSALERRSSTILSLESPLLNHLSDQGHLRILLDGIPFDDKNMINLILEGSSDMRPLYLWETRASLLARLALNPNAARLLLQFGIMNSLSEMQLFRYYNSGVSNEFVSNTDNIDKSWFEIYDRAITGTLIIIMSIISSLGPDDDSAVSQILNFLSSNVEPIVDSMQVTSRANFFDAFNQLSLLTSVVTAASSPKVLYLDDRDPAALETAVQTKRLKKQLLHVMTYFKPDGKLAKLVEEMPRINEEGVCLRERARTYLYHILSNCLSHCRDILLQGGPKAVESALIFQPTLELNASKTIHGLSIGNLVSILDLTAKEFMNARIKREETTKQLESIETAPYDSLHEFVSPTFLATASPSAVRKSAALHLETILKEFTKQEELTAHSVEACMFLLYRHLEHYIKRSGKPGTAEHLAPVNLAENIAEMKQKMVSMSGDILEKVIQVEKLYSGPTGHVRFLEGCITKIKWLLAF